MLRLIVIIHVVLCLGFDVYVSKFFTPTFVFSDDVRFSPCDEIFQCTVDNINGSLSTFAFCPTRNLCEGDDDCCSFCKQTVHWFEYSSPDIGPLSLSKSNRLGNPLFILRYIMLTTFIVLLLIFTINLFTAAHPGILISTSMGISLLLVQLATGFGMLYATTALVLDSEYYLNCQTNLALIVGWTWVHVLTFVDILTRVSPSHSSRMKRRRDRKRALKTGASIDDVAKNLTKRLDYVERKSTRASFNPCSLLFKFIARITVLWWFFITVYFIGMASGRWYVKLTSRYDNEEAGITFDIDFTDIVRQ